MNMAIFSSPRADSTTRTGEAGEHDGGDVIGRIGRRDDSALSAGTGGPASGAPAGRAAGSTILHRAHNVQSDRQTDG